MASLVTLTEALTLMQRTEDPDGQVQMALDAAEAAAESYTGRALASTSYTDELYDGTGRPELYLREWPVTAISKVEVADQEFGLSSASWTEWTLGDEFLAPGLGRASDVGRLVATDGRVWPEGVGNVRISYTAGYVAAPQDLKLAIVQLASALLRRAKEGRELAGERLGDYSYQVLEENEADLATVRATLNRYRRPAI